MVTLPKLIFTVGIISSFLIQTRCVDQYTDGNRPYEFGFNIDGEQHRHEKKDEKGLIMGEFGFITADGVYHVTVYATDEQGRFKILSMKNIRVKPYPTYKQPAGSARQGHSLDVQTPQQALPQQVPPTQATVTPLKKIEIEKPTRSCSSCSIPSSTTEAPAPFVQQNVQNTPIANGLGLTPSDINAPAPEIKPFSNQQNTYSNQNIGPKLINTPNLPNTPNNYNNPESFSSYPNAPTENQNITPPEQELVAPMQDFPNNPAIQYPYPSEPISPQVSPQAQFSDLPLEPIIPSDVFNKEAPQNYPTGAQNYPVNLDNQEYVPQIQSSGRTPKKYDGEPQKTFESPSVQPNGIPISGTSQDVPLNKPTLISAQMQIVNQNTDIYKRGPGEREGLPDGLTKEDMTQLLYTFNYTVGFHGHFEEGYRNGAKQGYYYVTGRNGVRTRVDYVADENGFRPKITQEVLDLLSDDVPKPETEKDEKYGLKGYEFKWLYYPIESKGR